MFEYVKTPRSATDEGRHHAADSQTVTADDDVPGAPRTVHRGFRVSGNTYYVGTDRVASHLVTGEVGHVLIDTGFPGDGPQILGHVSSLGFDASDIKIILISHAHYDHAGGASWIAERTGARVLIHRDDADEARAPREWQDSIAFDPVTIDGYLYEGEQITLGEIRINVYHTPGHTPGCCSFMWHVGSDATGSDAIDRDPADPESDRDATDPADPESDRYATDPADPESDHDTVGRDTAGRDTTDPDPSGPRAFIFGGPGLNVFSIDDGVARIYRGSIPQFTETLGRLEAMEPPEVFLAPHPHINDILDCHEDPSAKPPGTAEWQGHLNDLSERLAILKARRAIARMGNSSAHSIEVLEPTHRNLRYGRATRNVLHFVRADTRQPAPVVLFFHGGGFLEGDKITGLSRFRSVADACLAKGVSYATAGYRLRPYARLDEIMRDGARAVQYLRLYSADLNIDPNRIAALGVSAGAGMSLYLAFHPDIADSGSSDPVLRQSSRICCAGSFAGQATYDPRRIIDLLGPMPPLSESEGSTAQTSSGQIREHIDADTLGALLYGFTSEEDYESSEYVPLFDEVSPAAHLGPDAAPVFFYNPYPMTPPVDSISYVHHPKLTTFINEPLTSLGIDHRFRFPEDYDCPRREAGNAAIAEWLTFCFAHLGLSK